mgnify:CR=1 FL=1
MSVEEKLIEDLTSIIHSKYNGIATREHIKSCIPQHLERFFKIVARNAVLLESDFSISLSDDSSEEMWGSLSQGF